MYPATFAFLLVAICVFVPIFGIAFYMLKSARRAFGIAALFALGSTLGFVLAAALADFAVGHEVGSEFRDAFRIAFATGGSVAGGVLAVWALIRKTGLRP